MWRFAREIAQMVIAFIIFNMVSSAWDGMRYPVPQYTTPSRAYDPSPMPVPVSTPVPYVAPQKYVAPVEKIRISSACCGKQMFWTNLYELQSYNAAYKARQSTMDIMRQSAIVSIDNGTLVELVSNQCDYYQLRVLEGKQLGYVGWVDYLPRDSKIARSWFDWC